MAQDKERHDLMYTNKMQFEDLAKGLDGFEIHNKLYGQLVTERMTQMLSERFPTLIEQCRQSKDKYFNDVRNLSYWDYVGAICYQYVDHKLRQGLGINNSLCTKVCVVKCAVRIILTNSSDVA